MKSHLDRKISLTNAKTGDPYLLQPMWELEGSPQNLEAISAICNEELVYQWCFQSLCGGAPYPVEMASEWLSSVIDGWENETHFVYIITDAKGAVAAACDIKSADLEKAEIGYWSSAHHRGIMTNAVRAVVQLADNAGFQVLFADIHPENQRSLAVIKRCGFLQADREPAIKGHTPFDRPHPNRDR